MSEPTRSSYQPVQRDQLRDTPGLCVLGMLFTWSAYVIKFLKIMTNVTNLLR